MIFCEAPKCNKAILVKLGATIGATKLLGCPECHQVYWEKP